MTATLASPPAPELPLERRRMGTDEYLRMAEAGLLEGERIELIGGEIVRMSPIGSRHSWVLVLLHDELREVLGKRHRTREQATLPLDSGATVEPDLVVLRRWKITLRDPLPGPADVILAIEVSDTSLAYDLGEKARLYARAGIPEYWVVGVEGRIVVHRDPGPDGYRSIVEHPATARIALASHPEIEVDFSRIFD